LKFVRRFSRTERTLHWVNATGFLLLLATGLILYLPRLSTVVGRRPLIKDIHLWGGIGWISALAIVIVLGDRRGLLRTARDLEVLKPSRLNVGQKVNALLNAAFAILFLVSGLLLWFGERNTTFRFTSTVLLHDILIVRGARASRRSPLSRTDPSGDATLAARNHPRHGEGGLGGAPLPPLGSPAGRLISTGGEGREPLGGAGAERHVELQRRAVARDGERHLVARLQGADLAVRSSAVVTAVPSMAVITSPALRPALNAGEPALTALTCAPLPEDAVAIVIPR